MHRAVGVSGAYIYIALAHYSTKVNLGVQYMVKSTIGELLWIIVITIKIYQQCTVNYVIIQLLCVSYVIVA